MAALDRERASALRANPASAVQARDAALTRISRTRRWLLAGAAALTAAFAALASVLLPGKSLGAKGSAATSSSGRVAATAGTGTPQLPAPASPGELGLQGPSSAPQSSSSPESAAQPSAQSAPQPSPQSASAPSSASSSGGAVVSGGS